MTRDLGSALLLAGAAEAAAALGALLALWWL